jgi:hypothetical protein
MAQLLVEQNFPAIAIHRGMSQEERLSRYRACYSLVTSFIGIFFSLLLALLLSVVM